MGGTRTEPSFFGRAVYTDELPRRLDGNYLWVDEAAEPGELVAEAARLERRLLFVPDPAHGMRLAPWFGEQGWRIDRHLVMVQLRKPERSADLSLVREVGEAGLATGSPAPAGERALGEAGSSGAALPGQGADRRTA
jgi:hypothetical protein